MGRGVWWARVHGVVKSWTRLSMHAQSLLLLLLAQVGPVQVTTGTVQMTIELASPEAHVLPWERDLLAKIRYY